MTMQRISQPTNSLVGKVKAHHQVLKLMGCRFVLTAVHHDPQIAWDALRAGISEIERIEKLITSWRDDSQTGEINQNAGIQAVSVDKELFELIKRCRYISDITRGAFDISGTLSRYYWKFDGSESSFPEREKIDELADLVNYHNIILKDADQSVFLKKKGMKIGFGAIGKGYAALRAKVVMEHLGIENGLVNASGDLMAWGNPPNRNGWEIKIPHPVKRDEVIAQFDIPYGSVVTSGGYEKFALIGGVKFSHIIDPRTGMPVEGVNSVSIVCPNPELADGLATAVSVLGEESGMALINRLKGVEGIIVNLENEVLYSEGLKTLVI